MRAGHKFLSLAMLLLMAGLEAACSSAVDAAGVDAATQTSIPPFPTSSDGIDLDLVENRACLVKELVGIQVSEPQGDLIAWSPFSDDLAFVEPANKHWQWFVGELAIYSPNRDVLQVVSKGESVFGDITWSPGGAEIAYIVLDKDAQDYTVYTTDKFGKNRTDLFGSAYEASTDAWASRKGIAEWTDQNMLVVNSSCGSDCSRRFAYSFAESKLIAGEEIRHSEDTSLIPHNSSDSGDGAWSIRFDGDDNVWLTSLSSHRISLLLLNTPVDEVRWSVTSSFFAIRAADRILVYRPVCRQK